MKLLVVLAVAAPMPFYMNTGNLLAYGVFTLLYAILGLGLNIVVGFGGLLDLGHVAFFAIPLILALAAGISPVDPIDPPLIGSFGPFDLRPGTGSSSS